jgi:glycosyltransferase involved in cell wall biosynthesis
VAVSIRTLVLAGRGKPPDAELRRLIASDVIPDVVSSEDAIGATCVDDRWFAAKPGLRGWILRCLPLLLAQMIELCAQGGQYDAVLTWSDWPSIAAAAVMCGWRRRPAHVAILMWPSKPKKAIPLRLVQRRIDRVVVDAPLQRRFLQEKLGMSADRFVPVRPRVDTNFWRPMPGGDLDLICSVGREMRDYATLLEALEPTGIPCHLAVGTGMNGAASQRWWKKSLRGQTVPPGVTVGAKSYVELRALYARSRFVVVPLLPSDNDSGINTIREAFAMGKAVICTDIPGRTGILYPGQNCLLVPPFDPKALRRAILELWNDPEKCERLGRAGRELMVHHHGLEHWTRTLVTAVGEAVELRAAAGRTRESTPLPDWVEGLSAARPVKPRRTRGRDRDATTRR